jgi:chromosome segregation ATPase
MSLGDVESTAVIVGAIIGILGFLFAVATLLGGNYRVARNAKIVADYEAGYKGLQAKSEGQRQEIEELQRQGTEKDSRIAELEHELSDLKGRMSVLQEIVTGKPAIEELTKQMAAAVTMMNDRAGETLMQIGQLRTEVSAAHTNILSAVAPAQDG